MMTNISFSIELDIENLEVKEVKQNKEGHYEIYVDSTQEGCTCHICDKHIDKPHYFDREKRIRHLSILGRETYLLIRLPRFQCQECREKPTTTQQVPWHERRSPNTIVFEKYILLELMGSTIEEVVLQENIGYETVMGIIHRHIQTEIDWDLIEKLEQISLDEISLKKRHKDFVTIVSAYIDGRVQLLAVLKNRKKDAVKSIPTHLKKIIK